MKPEVKKYLNALQYLQDIYRFRKNGNSQFSYEIWAKELNASDKSYIHMMVTGKRPISAKMAQALIQNIALSISEQEYFLNLIQYTQSKNREHRDLFGKKLISLLKNELDQQEIQSHYEFLSNSLLPRLQVFLSFTDIDKSAQNLAWLLGTTEDEITKGLAQLTELQLITTDQNGTINPLKKSFKVPDGFGDLGLESFYNQNLVAAQAAIQLPKEERRFKSLFLPLNPEEFAEFLNNLQTFTNEQLAKFNPDQYADRRLYQAHFNIIPVSSKA
ncbi:TIGR02147 family protein [Bdellovibrio sp. HCB-110]|uniref:TIGR02147 family protein n=1 Tax=Bdellovibrio sp. HCB-110 TaxID=3391182 RepID=UPI0039B57848